MAGKIEISRVEYRRDAGEALQNGRLQIVDHDFGRHATKGRERVLVASEEMLHRLRDGKLHIHLPAVGEGR